MPRQGGYVKRPPRAGSGSYNRSRERKGAYIRAAVAMYGTAVYRFCHRVAGSGTNHTGNNAQREGMKVETRTRHGEWPNTMRATGKIRGMRGQATGVMR